MSASELRAVTIRIGTRLNSRIRSMTCQPSRPGQRDVEHDEVRMILVEPAQRLVAGPATTVTIAGAAHPEFEEAGELRLVLDDQDRAQSRLASVPAVPAAASDPARRPGEPSASERQREASPGCRPCRPADRSSRSLPRALRRDDGR